MLNSLLLIHYTCILCTYCKVHLSTDLATFPFITYSIPRLKLPKDWE